MVSHTRFFATSVFGATLAVLTLSDVAQGQVSREEGRPGATRQQPQPVPESDENPGILERIEAGFAGIFASERLQVHLNGAYQASSRRSEAESTFRAYGEQARFLTSEGFRGGAHIDLGGSLRIWRRLALGVSYTQLQNSGTAVVTGTVPHPLDGNRDRTAPAQTLSLPYRERATHLYAAWRMPLRLGLEVEFSAGPTYFNLRQGIVASLTPAEVTGPPFAEVGLQVDAGEHTRNGGGFNAGIDVMHMLTSPTRIPQFGIGYFVRVTNGTLSLPTDTSSWRRVSVGGVQTGVGLRLLF